MRIRIRRVRFYEVEKCLSYFIHDAIIQRMVMALPVKKKIDYIKWQMSQSSRFEMLLGWVSIHLQEMDHSRRAALRIQLQLREENRSSFYSFHADTRHFLYFFSLSVWDALNFVCFHFSVICCCICRLIFWRQTPKNYKSCIVQREFINGNLRLTSTVTNKIEIQIQVNKSLVYYLVVID